LPTAQGRGIGIDLTFEGCYVGAGACQVLLEYAPPLERCGPRTGPYPHPVMGRPVERDRLRCYWNRNTVGEEFIEHRAMVGAEI